MFLFKYRKKSQTVKKQSNKIILKYLEKNGTYFNNSYKVNFNNFKTVSKY